MQPRVQAEDRCRGEEIARGDGRFPEARPSEDRIRHGRHPNGKDSDCERQGPRLGKIAPAKPPPEEGRQEEGPVHENESRERGRQVVTRKDPPRQEESHDRGHAEIGIIVAPVVGDVGKRDSRGALRRIVRILGVNEGRGRGYGQIEMTRHEPIQRQVRIITLLIRAPQADRAGSDTFHGPDIECDHRRHEERGEYTLVPSGGCPWQHSGVGHSGRASEAPLAGQAR